RDVRGARRPALACRARAPTAARSEGSCFGSLRRAHEARNGVGQLLPFRAFGGEARASLRSESIRAHAAARLRYAPLHGDRTLAHQSLKRGIQRSSLDLEHVARAGANHLRDPIAVTWPPAERL